MNRRQRRAQGSGGNLSGGKSAAALKLARDMARQGHQAEAGNIYRQILQDDPDNVGALLDLGVAHIERHDADAAEPYLTRAVKLEPKNIWALTGLAIVKMEHFKLEEAVSLADRASRLDCPPPVLTKLGVLYKEAGLLDKARQHLRAAVRKKPDQVMAWFGLQDLKTFAPGDTDLAILRELATKPQHLPAHEQIHLQFILGKALLDAGETDAAFAHIEEGNRLKRATYKYDITSFEKYTDLVIQDFDEATVKRLRGLSTVSSERPVFIVSMFRAGSTLADQIISSHPLVNSIGEAKYFQQGIPVVPNAEMPGVFGDKNPSVSRAFMSMLNKDTLEDIGRKYLAATDALAGDAPRVSDKMPFNYQWAGLIRLALPNAKIIHCTREPMDTCFSIWTRLFAGDVPWAYDQVEIARYHRGYQRLMAHWNRLFPGEIYECSYERMISHQEEETRKLLAFCNLPFDAACLDFHKTERRVSTASNVQVRQPVYTSSIGKWMKYEKYLQPLIQTLRQK